MHMHCLQSVERERISQKVIFSLLSGFAVCYIKPHEIYFCYPLCVAKTGEIGEIGEDRRRSAKIGEIGEDRRRSADATIGNDAFGTQAPPVTTFHRGGGACGCGWPRRLSCASAWPRSRRARRGMPRWRAPRRRFPARALDCRRLCARVAGTSRCRRRRAARGRDRRCRAPRASSWGCSRP